MHFECVLVEVFECELFFNKSLVIDLYDLEFKVARLNVDVMICVIILLVLWSLDQSILKPVLIVDLPIDFILGVVSVYQFVLAYHLAS